MLLTLTKTLRFIAQGQVDNNLEPDRLAESKALGPNHYRETNPLIARPLSGSPNCA